MALRPNHAEIVHRLQRFGDMDILEEALASASAAESPWWRATFPEDRSALEAVCLHGDVDRRRALLDRLADVFPADHEFWKHQQLDTLGAGPYEWEFVRARGGEVPPLEYGLGLLEKAVDAVRGVRGDGCADLLMHLLERSVDYPEHIDATRIQKAWEHAVAHMNPGAMRALLAHGADPNPSPSTDPPAIRLLRRAGWSIDLRGGLTSSEQDDLAQALDLVAPTTPWLEVDRWFDEPSQNKPGWSTALKPVRTRARLEAALATPTRATRPRM